MAETTTTELAPLLQSSGLATEKQHEIGQTLGRFFEKAAEWTAKVDTIQVTDPKDTITMSMAREGRLGLRAMRLEAEKLVKEKREQVKALMADFQLEDKLWLKSGQMMELQFKHLEDKLELQEKFAERFEAQRKAQLKADRLAILAPLGYTDGTGLDTMTDAGFNAIVNGLKAKIQAEKEEAERKEAERLAQIQREKEERERIEAENARLKAEAEAKEKALAEERAAAEKQRIESEAKLKAERDRIAEMERQAKAKEEAERKAIAEAEAKRVADEKAAKAAADKAAKAPKKEKLKAWIDSAQLPVPSEFADDLIVGGISQKFQAFKAWAISQIEGL